MCAGNRRHSGDWGGNAHASRRILARRESRRRSKRDARSRGLLVACCPGEFSRDSRIERDLIWIGALSLPMVLSFRLRGDHPSDSVGFSRKLAATKRGPQQAMPSLKNWLEAAAPIAPAPPKPSLRLWFPPI